MAPDRGIVGDRHLVAIQTFDISRLTTHAVAIVPGTFVAVSGIGPKGDSNGSGKTTFLAAMSILLADPQWNLESSGGRHASGILFRPDAAGLDPSLRATPAPYGYVVGVFAEPDAVRESALTVWVRVSATSPYVQAKCAPWLHVADARTDEDRALQADRLWQELPQPGVISARRLAQELYGDAPRCLSYLDTSLRPAIPSLLSQEMTKMRPAEIGTALIALAGRTGQLEEENHNRGTTLELQAKLKEQEGQEDLTRIREDAELAGVSARDRARALLADAQQKWTRYAAWQYLAVLGERNAVGEEIRGRTEVLADREHVAQKAGAALATLRSTGDLAELERNARDSHNSASGVLQSLRDEHAGVAAEQAHLIKERNELQPVAARWKGTALKQARFEHDEDPVSTGHGTGRGGGRHRCGPGCHDCPGKRPGRAQRGSRPTCRPTPDRGRHRGGGSARRPHRPRRSGPASLGASPLGAARRGGRSAHERRAGARGARRWARHPDHRGRVPGPRRGARH